MASRCKSSKYQSSLTHGPALPAQPPQGRKRGNVNENQRDIKLENLGNYRPEWIRPGPVDFLTTNRLRAERETMTQEEFDKMLDEEMARREYIPLHTVEQIRALTACQIRRVLPWLSAEHIQALHS